MSFKSGKINKTCFIYLRLFLSRDTNQTLPYIRYKTCQFNNHNCTDLVLAWGVSCIACATIDV